MPYTEGWPEYYRKLSEKHNSIFFLIVIIVASLLLVSDWLFNNYPQFILMMRLAVTLAGYAGYLLFKLHLIPGSAMVLLYILPASFAAAYMIAWQPEPSGIIQAASIMIIYGFVILSLIIMTPRFWFIFSAFSVISYIALIVFIGNSPPDIYMVNGGTVLIFSFLGFPYAAVVKYRLLKKNYVLQKEIEFYANNDTLTGSFNRRVGMEILEKSIQYSIRNDHDLTISFIDLDGLKSINDELGHSVGDELIKKVADIIRKRIRKSDSLFRFGGDEFIVIFPECNESEGLNIMNDIYTETITSAEPFSASFSFGVAGYAEGMTADDFINTADERMYLNKREKLRD